MTASNPIKALNSDFWRARRVLVTGHTGFMGGWLVLLLHGLGAELTGFALEPETSPNLFEVGAIGVHLLSEIGDLRDPSRLRDVVARSRPEIVFHLAAQPLVRRAYADPTSTFEVNAMGTVHLLDALRNESDLRGVVVVTSDKVYDNKEWPWGYRESDELGGKEPYGASKACTEMIVRAYAHSYFATKSQPVPVATVRAGNVIGGGDWAEDRLIPDAMRAWSSDKSLQIRNPMAVRPWQHVIEPCRGYVQLAERMIAEPHYAGAWNFGPAWQDARQVSYVVDRLKSLWGGNARWECQKGQNPYEARLLAVDSSRSLNELAWQPSWRLNEALERTLRWYQAFYRGDDMLAATRDDIESNIHAQPACSWQ